MVKPDGPTKCDVAFLGEGPGAEEVRLKIGFVGPVGRLLRGMATTAGLPWRPDTWIGNVMWVPPTTPIQGSEIRKQLDLWIPKLKLPFAKVYIAVGNLACHALVSGNHPSRWRSIMYHAASVVPAKEAVGLVPIPNKAAVIVPIRHPSALLRGDDQWFPSTRLALQRAALVLKGESPQPPHSKFHLFTDDTETCFQRAAAAGMVTFDLETPYSHDLIYIGAFTVGEETWVFDEFRTVGLCRRLFAQNKIMVGGQNSATFDLPVLQRRGVDILGSKTPHFDTRWVHALLAPRMPHNLAHIATHTLPWAPPNWKPMISEDIHPMSEVGRRYCALDASLTAAIIKEQQADVKRRGWERSLDIRMKALPVITRCAILGARVDVAVRNKLRLDMAKAHEAILSEFYDLGVNAWTQVKLDQLRPELCRVEGLAAHYRCAAFSKKGAQIREDEGITIEVAVSKRDAFNEKRKQLKNLVTRLSSMSPTKKLLLADFLFHDPDGLKLRPGLKTKKGKASVGRKALDRIARRADVAAKIEKGDRRYMIFQRIVDAERLRSALASHLGVASVDGALDLSRDTQLHEGRIPVRYNPVQLRYSAGKSRDAEGHEVEMGVQVHNMSKHIQARVKGELRSYNLRDQIIADDPTTQEIGAYDWVRMEQYTMAWHAFSRLGYADWLEDLYYGVNTHVLAAVAALPGCPDTKEGAKAFKVEMGGMVDNGYDIGKKVNHAFTLGAGPRMLWEQYSIPMAVGRKIIERLERTERGQAIRRLHENIEQEAVETNKVATPFGESVDFWGVEYRWDCSACSCEWYDGHEEKCRSDDEAPRKIRIQKLKNPRKAYAIPQQGTAAIMMQVCMPLVDAVARKYGGRLILTTHDEFVLCYNIVHREAVDREVKKIMEAQWPEMVDYKGDGLSIPVEEGHGASWGEAG